MTIHNTEIEVVHASMMHQSVDAVVNAANPDLADGGGITGAIFGKAGPKLPAEIKQKYPKGTPTGTAVITGGYDLKQPYIIPTPARIAAQGIVTMIKCWLLPIVLVWKWQMQTD